MANKFSSADRSHLRRLFGRAAVSAALLVMFAVTSAAYTIVFRSGERLEIPDEFTLTRATLTYEMAPGFNKTVLVALIDVAATERANREAPGSFFKHIGQTQSNSSSNNNSSSAQPDPITPQPRAVRTLTNSDLASFRERRVEAEKAYEKRRQELGLPTVAESRRRQEEESDAFLEEIRAKSAANAEDERYWRGRARELRTEIAAVDNQINYVQARLTEVNNSSTQSGPVITEVYPIWPNNQPWGLGRRGRWGNNPNGVYGRPQPLPGWGQTRPNGFPDRTYGYPGT